MEVFLFYSIKEKYELLEYDKSKVDLIKSYGYTLEVI